MITADLDRFRRFYEDIFGFRLVSIDHPTRAPFRRLGTFTDGADAAVALIAFEIPHYRSELADELLGRRGRVDHLAFAVGDDDEFATITARLVDVGASSGAIEAIGSFRSVLFVDPDGGHHALQVTDRGWRPSASTEVIGTDHRRPGRSPADRATPAHIQHRSTP